MPKKLALQVTPRLAEVIQMMAQQDGTTIQRKEVPVTITKEQTVILRPDGTAVDALTGPSVAGMKRQGYITGNGNGVYTLTEKGRCLATLLAMEEGGSA